MLAYTFLSLSFSLAFFSLIFSSHSFLPIYCCGLQHVAKGEEDKRVGGRVRENINAGLREFPVFPRKNWWPLLLVEHPPMAVTRKRAGKEESSPAATAAAPAHAGYEQINSYTVRDKTPLTPKQKQEYAELQKPVPASEFGGVIGTPFLTFALPVVIYWIWASIEFNNGYLLRPKVHYITNYITNYLSTKTPLPISYSLPNIILFV